MNILAGIDIGGTKSAVSIGVPGPHGIDIIAKRKFPTPMDPEEAIRQYKTHIGQLVEQTGGRLSAVGIICGGPLDSKRGVIMRPPNLPLWDNIDILQPFQNEFSVPVAVQNDANACATAEWRWGAGRGCRNMVFLTFGTGMGAGLILNGQLYEGTNGMAGEIGHVRIAEDGPLDYGKVGTFSGFCSGGSIPRAAAPLIRSHILAGKPPMFCPTLDDLQTVTTEAIGKAAQQGDPLALQIFEHAARKLGQGISILVDVLNPERIVIGSIYVRLQSIIEPYMLEELRREALPPSMSVCEVVPAQLGEQIGDYASLSVAWQLLESLSEQ